MTKWFSTPCSFPTKTHSLPEIHSLQQRFFSFHSSFITLILYEPWIMNSLICLHFHSFVFHSACSKTIYGKGKSNIYPYFVSGQSHFSQEICNKVQILNMLNESLLVFKYKCKVNFKEKQCLDYLKPLCGSPPSRKGKVVQFHTQKGSSVFITRWLLSSHASCLRIMW